MTLRVLVCWPMPQVLVQEEKADQPETTQSTGQAALPQEMVWDAGRVDSTQYPERMA
jgi:hypothetical protein